MSIIDKKYTDKRHLETENEALKSLLSEYQDTLEAIRNGAVDALVVSDDRGERIYSLESIDYNYRVMAESMNEGSVTLDKDGTIVFANRAFSMLVGREMPVLVGLRFADLLPVSLHQAFQLFLKECAINPQRAEFAITGGNGDATSVALSGTIFTVHTRQNTCLIVNDLTERKGAEQKLRNAYEEVEKKVVERTLKMQLQEEELHHHTQDLDVANRNLEAKTRDLTLVNQELESFNYSVSHDLRNPLHAIVACLSVLSRSKNDMNVDAQKAIDYMKKTTERMSQVIKDLLSLSGISKKDMVFADVSLSDVAQEFMAVLKNGNPHNEAVVSIMPEITTCADEGFVRILLENLLRNAWKFSSKSTMAHIEFGVMNTEGHSVYYVKDNGAGFDMASARQMFEPFKRLHSQLEFPGTGIGLAIVKKIVERHGGTVWAEGEVGKGATFYFTLACPDRSPAAIVNKMEPLSVC